MTNWEIAKARLKLRGDKGMARCPAHDDRYASLSVKRDGDDVLLHCFCECPNAAIRAALGLGARSKASSWVPREIAKPVIEAIHKYTNLAGDVVAEKRKIRKPDGSKATPWASLDSTGLMRPDLVGVGGMDHLNLYNIVMASYAAREHGATVLVPEGEGCVDRLTEVGLIAVTNPEGASGSRSAYEAMWRWDPIPHGAHVVLLPDNDPAGERHAARLAEVLCERFSVRVLRFPGLAHKEDVADWIAAKRTAQWTDEEIAREITLLAAHAPPYFPPGAPHAAPQTDADTVEAFEERAALLEYSTGWPRAVAECAAAREVGRAVEVRTARLSPAERLMLRTTDPGLRAIYESLR